MKQYFSFSKGDKNKNTDGSNDELDLEDEEMMEILSNSPPNGLFNPYTQIWFDEEYHQFFDEDDDQDFDEGEDDEDTR